VTRIRLPIEIDKRSLAVPSELLDIICDPCTKNPLQQIRNDGGDFLAAKDSSREYPVVDGIPIFFNDQEMTGSNRKYRDFYDKIAFFYDVYIALISLLCRKKGWHAARSELIRRISTVRSGDGILEVGIGTGLNLELLPKETGYFGVDISWKMLSRCRRRAARLRREAGLCLAQAEALPFRDESFDRVFSVGGFNFFTDKQAAVNEMIRVAKPGATILIVDETPKHVKTAYGRTPLARKAFKDQSDSLLRAPVELVPQTMQDVRCEEVWNGRFYSLSFTKPKSGAPRA
jgi:ubiquinone/menaquinone biosynthesis C-methylase UbiE